ncbi:u13-Nephitoxin-Nsp1a_1 [Trichonephila clavata]|uniref:U13-Nephitoxin-Nsp1a_1 n=1 Tax=Trichonephila clavata TaxID=2740835 RepID=A0A8X6LD11_TRICU|nr:u13-Nephitoxin-Nsp1a_1 [Trichonephila clavata]
MLFVLSLVLCALGASLQGAEAASCHLREVDLCLATVLLGASEGIPADEEELDKVCEPVQEGIECIGNYSSSCFTPLLQEVFDMVISEPKKYQNLMCTHGTNERAEYLKQAPCLQKALSQDNMKPHLEDLMAALEKAAEDKFQNRVPIMCCGLQRMYKNLLDIVEAQCGKGVIDQGGMLIGMSASSISDIFCRGYEPGAAQCNGLLPPSGTPSQGSNSKIQLIQFLNTAISNWQ